jgi:putative nucleotidyltransferase with HDIG domain
MAHQDTVVVIDGNLEERDQIAAALEARYQVRDFGELDEAIVRMSSKRPIALVVDEKVPAIGRAGLVPTLRRAFQGIPIILCVSPGRHKDGVDVLLDKPFRRSQLINALARVSNKAVEDEWKSLAPTHARTLHKALDTFDHISDLIEVGEPLVYERIVDTCTPLLDAVTGSHYKPLLGALKKHDNLTYVHSLRVATLLSLFGHTIGLTDDALLILATGGLLHDMGKTEAIQNIINLPRKLTDEEMKTVRQHVTTTIGYLKEHSDVPKGVITIAAQHHERLDGSGYPKGLKGNHLNDLARMAAIVDVFSALTERRSYRPAMSPQKAFVVMRTEMQPSLDQRLVGMFQDLLVNASSEGMS